MAIKRKRINRKAELLQRDGVVVDLPPGWTFTVNCPHHGPQHFDFASYCANGREQLAREMRDAIWSMRHELVGATLTQYKSDTCDTFWRFLDERQQGDTVGCLADIDLPLLEEYLTWLALQVSRSGPHEGKPWSNGTQRRAFGCLKAILVNRMRRSPQDVHPQLAFPRNPFPNSNRLSHRRERYSKTEHQRILKAVSMDLRDIHSEGGPTTMTPLGVLAVHLVVLAASAGRNKQSLLELRRDSFSPHPLPDRELLVTTKRRGWSTHATSLRADTAPMDAEPTIRTIPATVGEHFRFLCQYTEPLVAEAAEGDKDLAFLYRPGKLHRGKVSRVNPRTVAIAVQGIAKRHELKDDRGRPLRLNLARLRPTFGAELYERTRDIRIVQRALGHVSVKTTADHYAERVPEADRDHAILVEGMVSRFTRTEVEGRVFLAADGKIPFKNVKDLLANGYSTGIARCQNPFREGEEVCQKFFYCFRCPNMCVFEDDLWRLFSFYYRLLAERPKLSTLYWEKTYGPIVRRIDVDIAPQFPVETVRAAKLKAQQNPHPTWRGPLL